MRLLRSIALAGALLAGSACSRIPIPEPQLEGAYGAQLKNDTRRAAIYSGLETRAFVHVTWLSPELVRQQAMGLSQTRGEPADVGQARLEQMQKDNAAPTFFAVVYMPEPSWNDWETKTSVWRIALEGGPLGEVTPVKIERFETPFHAELISLYPYLDQFETGYRIQFPPNSLGSYPKLRIAGTLGRIELDWKPPQ